MCDWRRKRQRVNVGGWPGAGAQRKMDGFDVSCV